MTALALAPADVAAVLVGVAPARLRADVDRLAGFGTRHTLSDAEHRTRGIGAARRWLAEEFRAAAPAVRVREHVHRAEPGPRVPRAVDVVNVLAEIPGRDPARAARRIVVVAHYDSRNSDPLDGEGDAPGANDDGSGTALLLELARVLGPLPLSSTVLLAAVAGEEQGLLGSRALARHLRAEGADVRAALGNDMVGDPHGAPAGAAPRLRVFSEGLPAAADGDALRRLRAQGGEGDSPSRQLARFVADVAALHGLALRPRLVFRPDRYLRGGDHLPFLDEGFPAVRFTDEREKFHRQHQDVRTEGGVAYGDVPQWVDAAYLADAVRLNAAAVLHLSEAPSPPRDARVVAATLSDDTTLRWSPAPEPDAAGYEVAVRDTTAPTWESFHDAGRATELTLPLCKDDLLFGVRSRSEHGWRSPVAFAVAARE